MYVSACKVNTFNNRYYNPYFKSSEENKERPCQVSKDIASTGSIEKQNKKLVTYAAAVGAGLIVAGGGVYGIRKLNSPDYVLKHLKPNKVIGSLPDFLKQELAKWNKFKKFEIYINNPNEKLVAGKGANSTVYNIPFMDNYVLKVVKPDSGLDLSKQYVGLFSNDINLGQAVWQHPNNPNVFLLKKINGQPYSIKNWTSTLYNPVTCGPISVTQAQADLYFKQISKISKMDQSVFDNLAHQIKVLDSTKKFENDYFVGFKTDSINPNNLMVDFKKNTINIIDYFGKENEHHKNSYMDMVAIMSDFALYPEYKDLLKPNQQKELVSIIKTIHDKALKAAQKEGISTNKNDFLEFINEVGQHFHPMPVKNTDGSIKYLRDYPHQAENLIKLIES